MREGIGIGRGERGGERNKERRREGRWGGEARQLRNTTFKSSVVTMTSIQH